MKPTVLLALTTLVLGQATAVAEPLKTVLDRSADLLFYTDGCDGVSECVVASVSCNSDGNVRLFAQGLTDAEAEEAKYGGYAPVWVELDGIRVPLTVQDKEVWEYDGLWGVTMTPTDTDAPLLASLSTAKRVVLSIGPAQRDLTGGPFADLVRACIP
jgi:hypothetical protein